MSEYTTPAELAEKLGVTEAKVLEWRRQHAWPSLKIGKTIRFTAEQVEQIIARHTSTPKHTTAATPILIDGQTKRSAARSAS